mmetsp:Transcript_70243/g.138102  ORF Transcript_70243/g.138102 Transcript_70243/m.138102 type:complete len:291 (+) Transcript_70243:1694-2566(+)
MLARRPLGGSVVILMARCRIPMGKSGEGPDEIQSLKSGCGFPSIIFSSMSFSKSASQEIIKWQLASSSQDPFTMAKSILLTATGPCPCPMATLSKNTFFWLASMITWLVGSTPGLKMKIRGVFSLEVLNTSGSEKGGGSANCAPKLDATNLVALNSTRSLRTALNRHMRWSSEHLSSQSPGRPKTSGFPFMYHAHHSSLLATNASARPLKLGSLSSSLTLSHPLASSHSGFFFCVFRSAPVPPKYTKSSSWRLILPSLVKMRMQSSKENRSLCRSNKPKHVYLYTLSVWK